MFINTIVFHSIVLSTPLYYRFSDQSDFFIWTGRGILRKSSRVRVDASRLRNQYNRNRGTRPPKFHAFYHIFISPGFQPCPRSLGQCALQAPVQIAMAIEKTKLIKLFSSFNCHLAPLSDSF